jgi:hypothetical protein
MSEFIYKEELILIQYSCLKALDLTLLMYSPRQYCFTYKDIKVATSLPKFALYPANKIKLYNLSPGEENCTPPSKLQTRQHTLFLLSCDTVNVSSYPATLQTFSPTL